MLRAASIMGLGLNYCDGDDLVLGYCTLTFDRSPIVLFPLPRFRECLSCLSDLGSNGLALAFLSKALSVIP